VKGRKPIEVAVVGGGCGAIATAFELTRPEHRGKYHVTIYQLGWRLGGKGASGRGPADRVQEHGLHIWMGFYENAFRLLRECYAELNRTPGSSRIADWRDAFSPAPYVSVADRLRDGSWFNWMAYLPPGDGLPGDPLTVHNPFTLTSYMARAISLVRSLLVSVQSRDIPRGGAPENGENDAGGIEALFPSMETVIENVKRLLKYGLLTTTAGLIEAAGLLELIFGRLSRNPDSLVLRLLEVVAARVRIEVERLTADDDEMRRLWEVMDLVVSGLLGILRHGLITDPRGFEAIDEYDCREWLRMNGASERSLESAMMRGVYDLAFAYEDGDFNRPRLAAGQALRRTLRMFLTYRGALFWKMRAGMGDVVFAPFYEVLKRRGVTFRFFHRLENVKVADADALVAGEQAYVEALEFDVQAEIKDGEYHPLVDSHGLPCWPAQPDYSQIVDGERLRREGWDFESHWDQRKVVSKTLRVSEDFDFVVLGVGLGAIPHVCREIVERDRRWRDMVERVKTVSTQAFQIWLREDMEALGWSDPPVNIASFAQPFDTWADMRQLIPEENWPNQPRAVAYFCSLLPDSEPPADRSDTLYPARRRAEVRRNAIDFLDRDIGMLWPHAANPRGGFRWELLMDPQEREPRGNGAPPNESRFDSQFWTANVNPTDRYVLSVPGSIKYRISPLDNTYDNLTIAGDWTDCGFNEGCVEAAVKSGRLAAHAISQSPALEEIIGYDHP
jgi:uncharacterized protein with NAD-binding domain and iron-sulfur cluster